MVSARSRLKSKMLEFACWNRTRLCKWTNMFIFVPWGVKNSRIVIGHRTTSDIAEGGTTDHWFRRFCGQPNKSTNQSARVINFIMCRQCKPSRNAALTPISLYISVQESSIYHHCVFHPVWESISFHQTFNRWVLSTFVSV